MSTVGNSNWLAECFDYDTKDCSACPVGLGSGVGGVASFGCDTDYCSTFPVGEGVGDADASFDCDSVDCNTSPGGMVGPASFDCDTSDCNTCPSGVGGTIVEEMKFYMYKFKDKHTYSNCTDKCISLTLALMCSNFPSYSPYFSLFHVFRQVSSLYFSSPAALLPIRFLIFFHDIFSKFVPGHDFSSSPLLT